MKNNKLFRHLALYPIGFLAIVTAIAVVGGQFGLLRGSPPAGLGSVGGRLAAPSPTPNSVSSQTPLHPGHVQAGYAHIAPFTWSAPDTGTTALARLDALLQATPGVTVVARQSGYLRAEAHTRWLGFVDDVELLLDAPGGVIHVRSASRLGRNDFGANRARVEALRQRLLTARP